jgi:4-hydroxy-3-polyprenylbenzoate decarboxylase
VIVVDEDIDPSNVTDVLWALATRSDPESSIEIMRRCWSTSLDTAIPRKKWGHNSRAIIDACRPYEWMADFPKVVEVSQEIRERTWKKWQKELESALGDTS